MVVGTVCMGIFRSDGVGRAIESEVEKRAQCGG